ncbi:MAG: S49 family peptidase, partial [Planctomycetia bacterium]
YAEPGTLTGSIGVVGGKMNFRGLMDKFGVKSEILSRGKNSGVLSVDAPFTDSEQVAFRKMLEETYKQFTTKAAEGRKMPLDKLESLAGGRIWSGRQAKANGLVDELGTFADAVAAAKKLANLEGDVELENFPKTPSVIESLFGDLDSSKPSDARLRALGLDVGEAALQMMPPAVREELKATVGPLLPLLGKPVLLVHPAAVRLR